MKLNLAKPNNKYKILQNNNDKKKTKLISISNQEQYCIILTFWKKIGVTSTQKGR